MSNEMKKIVQKAVIKSYDTKENVFDIVLKDFDSWYARPVHDLNELKKKESKKVKGDRFEDFCQLYLQTQQYKNVWLLQEVPEDILKKLGLKRKDYGIDLVCEDSKGKYTAVQAKYRSLGRKTKNVVTWNMLSTFYALCLRTGPWERYIVITNADYITHMGKKTVKDKSICIGSLRKITKNVWLEMGNFTGEIIEPVEVVEVTAKEPLMDAATLREKRLERFADLKI